MEQPKVGLRDKNKDSEADLATYVRGTRYLDIIGPNELPPIEKWRGFRQAEEIEKRFKTWDFTTDTFIEDTKKMIGYESWTESSCPDKTLSPPFDEFAIRDYNIGRGDLNPIYIDSEYAKNTRYGCLIVPGTILSQVKYNLNRGVIALGPYPLSSLQGGWSWEWNDVIKVGDRFRCSCKLKDVFEKKGRTGRLVFMVTDLSFWDKHDDLFAIGGGSFICIGKTQEEEEKAIESMKRGEGMADTMLYDRATYHYSDEEIEKITSAIKSESRRGSKPLYWEDVNVGDKLTPLVKGPQTFQDFMGGGRGGTGGMWGAFEIGFYDGDHSSVRLNPLTGWPYEFRVQEHYDFNLCRMRGLPGPFDSGTMRVSMIPHLLSNWMGDDGFIRRLDTQIRKPNYYGDTQWFNGEVISKYKDKVAGVEYSAVDIGVMVMNQVDEVTLPTRATVYLPSRELGEVTLPVPNRPEEEWVKENTSFCLSRSYAPRMTTKYHLKDFFEEIDSGETIFPYFAY